MSLEIFSLGACLVAAPVNDLIKSNRATDSWSRLSAHNKPAVYTVDEALQVVRFMRGDLDLPPLVRSLCEIDQSEDGPALRGCFDNADVVLVEINSPLAIRHGDYALSRAEVRKSIVACLTAASQSVNAGKARRGAQEMAFETWYHKGMMDQNGAVREVTARLLMHALAGDHPDWQIARTVLAGARPHHRDLAGLIEGLAELRDAFSAPLGVVTYTHTYMPDGRALPWPPDFVEQTLAAARHLELPVFQPSAFVQSFGVDRALMPDRVHFRPEFAPVLAEPLWDFMRQLVDRSRGPLAAGREHIAVGGS